MIPETTVAVNEPGNRPANPGADGEFEDHDDVQEVYANFDIPDEILNKLP